MSFADKHENIVIVDGDNITRLGNVVKEIESKRKQTLKTYQLSEPEQSE